MEKCKKWMLVLSLLFSCFYPKAQNLGRLDVHQGVHPYYLGSIKNLEDSFFNQSNISILEWKGRVEKMFLYNMERSDGRYMVGSVPFINLFVTSVNDTIIRLNLLKFYNDKLYTDFKTMAKREFRDLCDYLRDQWGSSGRKKDFGSYRETKITGFEWNRRGHTMKAIFYEDIGAGQPSYSIELILELSKYNY